MCILPFVLDRVFRIQSFFCPEKPQCGFSSLALLRWLNANLQGPEDKSWMTFTRALYLSNKASWQHSSLPHKTAAIHRSAGMAVPANMPSPGHYLPSSLPTQWKAAAPSSQRELLFLQHYAICTHLLTIRTDLTWTGRYRDWHQCLCAGKRHKVTVPFHCSLQRSWAQAVQQHTRQHQDSIRSQKSKSHCTLSTSEPLHTRGWCVPAPKCNARKRQHALCSP